MEEAEVSKPSPPASKDEDEDFQAILRTRKERRQRRQVVEAVQAPVQERLEAEEEKDSLGPEQTSSQPLVPKKKVEALPRRRLSREQRGPWAQEEEQLKSRELAEGKKGLAEETAAQQKTLVSEKTPISEKTPVPTKRLVSEKACPSEKGTATEKVSLTEKRHSPEKLVPERTSVTEKSPVPEKTLVSLKTAAPERRSPPVLEKAIVSEKMQERKLVSEKASIFEKSLVSEAKLTPKKAAVSEQPQTLGGSQATTREPRGRALPEKSPPSSAEQSTPAPPTKASRFPPITLQVGTVPFCLSLALLSRPYCGPALAASGSLVSSSPPIFELALVDSSLLVAPCSCQNRTLSQGQIVGPARGHVPGTPGFSNHVLIQVLDSSSQAICFCSESG